MRAETRVAEMAMTELREMEPVEGDRMFPRWRIGGGGSCWAFLRLSGG